MSFGMKRGYKMEGGYSLVLNSNFRRMVTNISFYRYMISLSIYHNSISTYTALPDTIDGHFLTNILLRTCIVIKVTLPTFHISYRGENSFYLQPFGYLLFYIYLYRIMPCKVNSNPLFLQSVVNILTVVLAKHNHSSVP